MRALVTGGGGFLGGYIVERLLGMGWQVTSFSRGDYPQLKTSGVECIRGDLTDSDKLREACENVDCVFHVAALARLWGSPRAFYETNVLGTGNIIDACRAAGIEKLLYTSSPSVVFSLHDLKGVNEQEPYRKKYASVYASTKATAEKMVLAANSDRLATCALRPHMIWGPRDTNITAAILERARKGKLIKIGSGHNLVDLCYAENAADAHILALERLSPGSVCSGNAYFITDGKPVILWKWIEELLLRTELPPPRRSLSRKTALLLGWFYEILSTVFPFIGDPPLTRYIVGNLANSHYFDITAARRDLGYIPRIGNEEGLEKTVVWFSGKKER